MPTNEHAVQKRRGRRSRRLRKLDEIRERNEARRYERRLWRTKNAPRRWFDALEQIVELDEYLESTNGHAAYWKTVLQPGGLDKWNRENPGWHTAKYTMLTQEEVDRRIYRHSRKRRWGPT